MGRIAVHPADRTRRVVIPADVVHKLAAEVGHGCENAAGDHVSFNLGEPELYLIKPGAVGRSVVQAHARVLEEEVLNEWCFVRAEIIEDHVDFLSLGLASHDLVEEADERDTRVTRDRAPQDLSALRVECGEEGERAMPVVLEPVTLGPSRRERQYGIHTVECLDTALLVDREDSRVRRGIQIEAENISGFFLEERIVGGCNGRAGGVSAHAGAKLGQRSCG